MVDDGTLGGVRRLAGLPGSPRERRRGALDLISLWPRSPGSQGCLNRTDVRPTLVSKRCKGLPRRATMPWVRRSPNP
jgi:hypothetical protein